ncbi:MAG: alpha-glucosidase C-terminal domain-containing protein, partial [Anaerolineales bacterium]|nr:alpha-glucosidase C-terminal domain-containing protein [Anaerolineales bacterium]
EVIHTGRDSVLAFTRFHEGKRVVIFANFSETMQIIEPRIVNQYAVTNLKRLHGHNHVSANNSLVLEPLDFVVFG